MDVIRQKDLRNQVGEVLRRVEGGESLTVTVAGRAVAELRPVSRPRWLSGQALASIWDSPTPRHLMEDLEPLGGAVVDPNQLVDPNQR